MKIQVVLSDKKRSLFDRVPQQLAANFTILETGAVYVNVV